MSSDAEQKNSGSPNNGKNKDNDSENDARDTITHRQHADSNSSFYYNQLHRTGNTAELNADEILSLKSNETDINTLLLPIDDDGNIITPYPKEYEHRRLSQQFNIPINTYRGNKLNSAIIAARIGMLIFFLRTFFLLQPYDQALSNYIKEPHNSVKVAMILILSVLIISSVLYLWKNYTESRLAQQNELNTRGKVYRAFLYVALTAMICAEVSFSIQLFLNPIVQWLTPTLFSLSCVLFMLNSFLNQKKCMHKILFSLCFMVCAAGNVTMLLNTADKVIPGLSPHQWTQTFVPLMLMVSMLGAVIITLESCIDKCISTKNKAQHNHSAKIHSHYTNQISTQDSHQISTQDNTLKPKIKNKKRHTNVYNQKIIISGLYHDNQPIHVEYRDKEIKNIVKK